MNRTIERGMLHIARIGALAVAIVAVAVFIGYALRIDALIHVIPGLQGMSPLTAAGLFAVASSILMQSWGKPRGARIAAYLAAGLGSTLLLSHAATGQDALSPIVGSLVFGPEIYTGGRASIATAACVLALAAAALGRERPHLPDFAAAGAMVASWLALLGYAYGVRDLYAIPVFATMALHTALSVFALSVASMFVLPHRGWAAVINASEAGGGATRRQLAFILVLPVLGWVLLQATSADRLGPAAAMAFLVTLTVAPLALLILRDGKILNALELERSEKAKLQADQAGFLERQLEEQAAHLQHESAERASAEAAMFRAQRMEAMGQLTGGIAHDFNNLLMAISGSMELLLRRLGNDPSARRLAENAADAAGRATKLTGQLLAFSRTQKMNVRPMELDPVLNSARTLLGNALGPEIRIDLALGTPGMWAMADPDQLEMAVLNLALNARDAMPDGGTLTLESCPGAGGEAAEHLLVRVTDTGHGMTPEVAAQAVEPFFTTKEVGKGTGLGLSQVYGFARQCRGDLHISSGVGLGTTIELQLPRASRPAPARESRPTAAAEQVMAPPNSRQLLLVIDDDDSVRTVLVEILREAGFSVIEASNGLDGLEHLRTHTPAAAIIDFLMPGLNGAEVARRAQSHQPGLPIIFVSGYFDTVALDGIKRAVVLRKPFDVANLHEAVSSALQ